MSIDVTAETIIDQPRSEVADFAMDPANDTRWIGGITEATMLTDPPLAVGSRVARIARFLARRIEYVNEVTQLEPGVRLEMRSVKAPFPMQVTYAFEDTGGATKARIQVSGDAGGFYKLASPLLGAAVRRSVSRDLENLKALLESGTQVQKAES